MAAFSILTHDRRSTPSPTSGSVDPPVLSFHRPGVPTASAELARVEKRLEARTAPDMEVVLTLPDLTAVLGEDSSQPWFTKLPLFWIAITLGALLAIALISTGGKPVPRPVDEAPSWSSQSAPQTEHAATVRIEQPASPSAVPTWSPSSAATPATTVEQAAPQSVSTEQPPSGTPVGVRTARGNNPQWDGTADRVGPGEAAPLGISTTVPQ